MAKKFRVKPTVFTLTFEDEQYEGLEIKARSLPLREFIALQDVSAGTDTEATRKFIGKLADAIVGWNLEDDQGNPVAPDEEGLGSLEIGFVLAILEAWMGAIASVPNRLKPALNGGGTSPELLLPMEL